MRKNLVCKQNLTLAFKGWRAALAHLGTALALVTIRPDRW